MILKLEKNQFREKYKLITGEDPPSFTGQARSTEPIAKATKQPEENRKKSNIVTIEQIINN
jgi:hypothetical protein